MHFLKNAAWLSAIMWVFTFAFFVVFLLPAGALIALFPGASAVWAFGFALVLAVAVKKAIMEPIAIAALMQVYFKEIEGQTPNPEWTAKLEKVSSKFRDLGQKAAGWIPGPAVTTPPPAKPA